MVLHGLALFVLVLAGLALLHLFDAWRTTDGRSRMAAFVGFLVCAALAGTCYVVRDMVSEVTWR